MRLLIQRVKEASVVVCGETVSSIKGGILAFLGIAAEDDGSQIDRLVKKITELRIFPDEEGKMNLSVKDVGGAILLVSQFTLCADTSRGRRPDFFTAAGPESAKLLFDRFTEALKKSGVEVQTGVFGAFMEVNLINDGPVTFMLER